MNKSTNEASRHTTRQTLAANQERTCGGVLRDLGAELAHERPSAQVKHLMQKCNILFKVVGSSASRCFTA